MNASNMNKPSETDWRRVEEMTDEEMDTSDSPPLGDAFFEKARLRVPTQVSVTIRVDADLLDWLKEHGEAYESLINTVLRSYVEEHKVEHR